MSHQPPYGSDPYGSGQPGGQSDNDPYGGQSGQQSSGSPQYGDQSQYGDQPQYGSQPGTQQYGDQPQYGSQPGTQQYGEQPQYGSQQYGEQQPSYQAAGGYPGGAGGSADQYSGGDQYAPDYSGQADPYGSSYGSYGSGGNSKAKNIFGILALIAGILALIISGSSWIPILGFFAGGAAVLFAIGAIILGIIGMSAAKKGTASNKGLSLSGIILGGLAILLTIILIIVQFVFLRGIDEASKGLSDPKSDSTSSQSPDRSADPSTSAEPSGDASAPPADDSKGGSSVDLTAGVTMAVSVGPDTVAPRSAQKTNGEVARVEFEIKNTTGQEFDPGFPTVECTYSGGKCDDVFSSENGYRSGLSFDKVAAGKTEKFAMAFAVPRDAIDSVKLEVTIPKSDQKYNPYTFTRR